MRERTSKQGRKPPIKSGSVLICVEENGKVKKLRLKWEQICWEGYRRLGEKFLCGVPKKSSRHCLRYCSHEGCDIL